MVSSLVRSALMPPATTLRPLPRMVILARSSFPDSSSSFAALHFRRSVSRCVSESLGAPLADQLLLDQRREREIEVVAAEQQVLANGNPFECELPADGRRAHQAEVRRPAADVAHQHQCVVGQAGRSCRGGARRSTQ